MRSRFATVSAVAFSLFALLFAGQAGATAEVHRLSLVLSANPTGVAGGDLNKTIDFTNSNMAANWLIGSPEPIEHVAFTWAYDAELRYFVRPNFAVSAGLTHIRAVQKKEYLPAVDQSILLRAQVLTVPVHVGGAYYLQPYNQGDFQARAFVGGGLVQYTYSRESFDVNVINPFIPGGGISSRTSLTSDSPGYYLEGGAHMFFASRYSVMISALYRSGKLRDARYDQLTSNNQDLGLSGTTAYAPAGNPYIIDVSGVGVRFAVSIGL